MNTIEIRVCPECGEPMDEQDSADACPTCTKILGYDELREALRNIVDAEENSPYVSHLDGPITTARALLEKLDGAA